ncbi:MAG: efflux RND transporter periplasmic adaptor subunit [Desulfuromonas sp.]|nr:MAG: efflux RND transporter periplasmic adaptor subunit [Desulfuromonas sp.]
MEEPRKRSGLLLKILLPLLILLIGIGGFKLMMGLKKEPQRKPTTHQGVPVSVTEVAAATEQIIVRATGTVQPDQEITIVPEVTGKVEWLSPKLISGGLFKTGEPLLRIATADYQLAVDQARATVAKAQVSLATEQEQAKVALAEWARMNLPDKGEPGPLVTREIQLLQEQANLDAAEASLKLALLNLQRTEIRAPFNGRISAEQVDLGQYLRSGTSIATFSGTDRAEIHVELADRELKWLQIPAPGSTSAGSTAVISLPDEAQSARMGQISRSLGEIDQQSRMATVVVSVSDPYCLASQGECTPLLNGRFVDVELRGANLADIVSIPRKALHPGDIVWIADSGQRLQVRQVDVLHRDRDKVLLKGGLNNGDQLILSSLAVAAEGTLLRPVPAEEAQ